jgi:hypothetical protein
MLSENVSKYTFMYTLNDTTEIKIEKVPQDDFKKRKYPYIKNMTLT